MRFGGDYLFAQKTAAPANGEARSKIGLLDKFDGNTTNAQSRIEPFSYLLNGDAIQNGEVTVTRDEETVAAGLTTRLRTTAIGIAGYRETAVTLNGDGLTKAITLILSNGTTTSTETTSYEYLTDRTRYAGTGAPVWGKVDSVVYPDGSWEAFRHDLATGWLNARISPFQSSAVPGATATDFSAHRVQEISYDAAGASGGMQPEQRFMTAQARRVVQKLSEVKTGRTYYHVIAPTTPAGSTVRLRQVASAGASADALGSLESVITPSTRGPDSIWNAAGSILYGQAGTGANLTSTVTRIGPRGTSISVDTIEYDGLGNAKSTTTTSSGRQILNTQTHLDAFGRSTKSTNILNGLSSTYSYSPSNWFGPTSFNDVDGSVTTFGQYNSLGLVKSAQTYGVTSAYTHDMAGNLAGLTRSATGISSTSVSATYDALGRMRSFKDELDKQTLYDFYLNDSTFKVTVTNPDGTTAVNDYHLDGSPKSLSGTAVYPVAYSSGFGIASGHDDHTGTDDDNVFWTEVRTNDGQNRKRVYYDALGRAFRATQSGAGSDERVYFDGLGRAVRQAGLDGVQTLIQYDDRGMVRDVVLDADKDGIYTPGSADRRSYFVSVS